MTPRPFLTQFIHPPARWTFVLPALLLALFLLLPGAGPAAANPVTPTGPDSATLIVTNETSPAGATGFKFAILAAQWGGEGSGDGQFNTPYGVAVDGAGHVYVADSENHRIQKFDGDGNYLGQWGSYGDGDGQFKTPRGVAVDGAGHVYVADLDNYRIQTFDGGGNYLDQWGGPGSGDGQFNSPSGVAVDAAGYVYVVDNANYRIQRYDGNGNYFDEWGGSGNCVSCFSDPTGVATDGKGHVYVADSLNKHIQKFAIWSYLVLYNGHSQTFSNLRAGIVKVSELVPTGWALDDITCDGGSPVRSGDSVSLTLALGDDVTCTFTNTGPADTTPPSVTINKAAGQPDPTSAGPIHFTAIFSEAVSGFTSSDVAVASTAGAVTATVTEIAPNNGTTYDVAVSGMNTDGVVVANVGAGAAQDAAGNDNTASTSTDNSVTYIAPDTTPPTVTINQAAGQPDPTNTGHIHFTAIFSEAVSGFTSSDVAVASTAGAVTATVTEIAPNNGTTYDVAVSGMNTDGIVIANIGAGAAQDAAGNDNTASTSTDNSVTYNAPPQTTIATAPPALTNDNDSSFTFSSNEPGGTFECQLDGGDWVACHSGTMSYTDVADGQHTFKVRAIDVAGNTDPEPATHTWTIDTAPPDTTITTGPDDLTTSNDPSFSFTSNETGSSFTCQLDGLPAAPCATPQSYTDLADGPHTFTVFATDAAGNADAGPATDSWTVDTTPPSVTINQAAGQPDPTHAGPIHFTAVFSEAVSGFTGSDVALASTAGAVTAIVTQIAPNNGTTYDVAVSSMNTDGIVVANIGAGAAQDAAGNGNTASTSTDNSVTYKPVLIYITTTGANGTAVNPNGTTVAYTKGDILKWNGQVWSKWFSSAARGLPANADIYAFDVGDEDIANEAAGSVWLALGSDQKKVPGLGRVTAHEIVYFNGQSFSRFFDGTDVGLKTSGERVNGLEVLPGSASPIGSNCLHYLLISTVAGGGVPVGSSNVNFTGEDVLGFCMTSMGANTAGQWHLVFEGQSHGLQKNNNRGLSANANATTLYFTAKTAFGAIPAGAIFSWNGSSFSGALWRATDHGVTREVDGIDVVKLGITN